MPLDPTIIASLISGGASLVGGIGSTMMGVNAGVKMSQTDRNFALYQQMINNNYQTSERLAAQQYATDMWHMSNEYNSPVAQLERARLAGINPNAVIAGMYGGVAANPMSSTGQSGVISGYSSGLGSSIINSYQNMGRQIGEAGLLAANVRKTNAEAKNIETKTAWDNASFDARLKFETERTNKLVREIQHIDFDEKQTAALNEWKCKLSESQIGEIAQRTNELRNKVLLTAEQIITERKKQNQIDVGIEETRANIANIKADTEVKEVDKELKEVQREIQRQVFAQEWVKAEFSMSTNIPIGAPAWQSAYKLWQEGYFDKAIDVATFSASTPVDVSRVAALVAHRFKEVTTKEFKDNLNSIIDEGKDLYGKFNEISSVKKQGGLKGIFIKALIESMK